MRHDLNPNYTPETVVLRAGSSAGGHEPGQAGFVRVPKRPTLRTFLGWCLAAPVPPFGGH